MAKRTAPTFTAKEYCHYFRCLRNYLSCHSYQGTPPGQILPSLINDIAAIAAGDRTASLICLQYSLAVPPTDLLPRRRKQNKK